MFRIGTQMVTLLLGVLLGVIATVLLYSSSEGVIGTVLLSRVAPSSEVEATHRFLGQLPTVNIDTALVIAVSFDRGGPGQAGRVSQNFAR